MPDPAQRRALVAGATGLVGRALLALLEARNASIEIVARRSLAEWSALRPAPRVHVAADFSKLPPLPPLDDCFIALGTTIRLAGSQAAFRAVDFDAVVAVAKAARAAGATRLGLVSAHGADPASRIFYNRTKGEAEVAVASLGYECVVVARPSFITGDRASLGQADRPGEGVALGVLRRLGGLVPASVRPIADRTVAAALVDAVEAGRPGVRVLTSAAMQTDQSASGQPPSVTTGTKPP